MPVRESGNVTNLVSPEKYGSFLDYMIKRNKDEIVPCADQGQAELLLKKLFQNTTSIVKMIIGTYPPKLTEHLVEERYLHACINKSIPVQVLIAEDHVDLYLYFRSFCSNHQHLCSVKEASLDAKNILETSMTFKNGHYMTCFLFDENKYMVQLKDNSFTSTANFNSQETAKELNKIFDDAYIASKPH